MRVRVRRGSGKSGGLGVSGVLTIVFVVLKLVGVIDWSWVWVLAPLWIGAAIGLLLVAVFVVISILSQ